MTTSNTLVRTRGRPREFNLDEAVDGAIDVFRQRGYSASSLPDLMSGTGLSRGSVYKAFKNKKSLFLAAYDRYAARGAANLDAIVAGEGTARERLRKVLTSYATTASGEQGRLGCLVVATAIEVTTVEADIRRRVTASMDRLDALLQELLRQGQRDGSIARNSDIQPLAATLLCLMQGMRVVGKSDKHRRRVAAVVEHAMKMVG